jgi:CRP/FNR family transcriptional regulator
MGNQSVGNHTIIQFLNSHPLFAGLKQGSLEEISRASTIKRVPKGAYLFFQFDPAIAFYLVWQGMIASQLENLDGRELVINEMKAGDCLGELGLLTDQPHSTSALALADSVILVIPRATFLSMLKQEPILALRLLEITAQRLQDSSRREEALAFHDAAQRLARLLLALDAAATDKGYLSLSQEELAQRAGLTRQTVAAILGRWRRSGWLLTGRGHIVVLNRRELSRLIPNQDIESQV